MDKRNIKKLLTEDILTYLLGTAANNCGWLQINIHDKSPVGEDERLSRERIWAKVLLAGGTLECYDVDADLKVHGTLRHDAHLRDDWDGPVTYFLTLQDVIDGLKKCLDGTVEGADEDFLRQCCMNLLENGDWNVTEPDALMQVIVLGGLVYELERD